MASKNIPVMRCQKCNSYYVPVKYSCNSCGSRELEIVKVDGTTLIYSHTTIRIPPEVYRDQVPYDIALVILQEIPGLMFTSRVMCSGENKIEIGKEVVFTGTDELGYRFELKRGMPDV
ncbi:MAG: hypothetical protein VR69_06415 [Peptococcaceae bacterium BRH_c4b]|nr:MAG: hypothetical protein VR69_06415 [Peptococcaceae bacterium BRH_c4b]